MGSHASLRRADWRFLLPRPPDGTFDHLVLVGARPHLADRLLAEGIARRVSSGLPGDRSADAVVVAHPARVSLAGAASCLRPGGSLYYEVDRRSLATLALTPRRLRRHLRAVGLSPTGTYLVWPDCVTTRAYIPLHAREAVPWFISTLSTASTPGWRLVEAILRALSRLGSGRFGTLAPCLAVTAGAGAAGSALAVFGHPSLQALSGQPALHPLLLTGPDDERSRVIVLPFGPDSTRPLVVLKVPRSPAFNTHTEREQRLLAEIRSRVQEPLRSSIPEPGGLLRFGRVATGVESYLPGRCLRSSSGRWRAPFPRKLDDLRLATEWLRQFHRQGELSREAWAAADVARWVEDRLAAYSRLFGTTAAEERLFTEVHQRAAAVIGRPFPVVWQHRDFGEWNVFRDGDTIYVLDWEQARPGPALTDLVYFVTHWSYAARDRQGDGPQLRGFRELFLDPLPPDNSVRAARRAIDQYVAGVDLDRGFLPLLHVLTWVEHALDRLERQRAVGEESEESRSGNRYVLYVDLLAQHVDRLFADRA